MSEKVYLNGELIEISRASVGVSSPAVLHGVGLFETIRVYEGQPFRLAQHIDRLQASAKKLNIQVGEVISEISPAIEAVLKANELKNARLRFTIIPPSPNDEANKTTLLVAAQAITGYPPELYQKGISVYVCNQYRQSAYDPLAGHKTTSYLPRLLALRDAQDHQCGEALWFTPENFLAEGCISNVFIVKKGQLRTPPLDTPILPGITRAVVLELAATENIPVDEAPCTINDLLDADELFLTNSVMELMPVTRVERRAIADEQPGPITQKLRETYRKLTQVAG